VTVPTRLFRLPDGRQTAYCDGGDPDGYPVIALHGTPGCRFSRWPAESVYIEAGVRYITPDRAGYGQASRKPGRTVADEAADVLALADKLGLDRFAVTGGSGGGGLALACGALLPAERIERVACAVGLAPYGPGGLPHQEWIAGQTSENVQEIGWALDGEEALARGLTASQADLAERLVTDPASLFGDDVPDADRQFFAQPEIVEEMKLITAEQAAHGIYGWVDDILSQLSPWGFDLSQITVPVLLSYGLKDAFTPPAHGHWLAAHLPTATVEVNTEAGHTGTDPEAEITRELTWLRGA
jgi:pimeloyl-ACP methyl ester carboxylesterase